MRPGAPPPSRARPAACWGSRKGVEGGEEVPLGQNLQGGGEGVTRAHRAGWAPSPRGRRARDGARITAGKSTCSLGDAGSAVVVAHALRSVARSTGSDRSGPLVTPATTWRLPRALGTGHAVAVVREEKRRSTSRVASSRSGRTWCQNAERNHSSRGASRDELAPGRGDGRAGRRRAGAARRAGLSLRESWSDATTGRARALSEALACAPTAPARWRPCGASLSTDGQAGSPRSRIARGEARRHGARSIAPPGPKARVFVRSRCLRSRRGVRRSARLHLQLARRACARAPVARRSENVARENYARCCAVATSSVAGNTHPRGRTPSGVANWVRRPEAARAHGCAGRPPWGRRSRGRWTTSRT